VINAVDDVSNVVQKPRDTGKLDCLLVHAQIAQQIPRDLGYSPNVGKAVLGIAQRTKGGVGPLNISFDIAIAAKRIVCHHFSHLSRLRG
jgi:hypothetical protein